MPIHFTADKKTLVSLIQPTMTAVSSRNTLPALEGLLFTLQGNELSVCGYDLEKGVKTVTQVQGLSDGAVILNAQKVFAIVRNFPDCDITFRSDDKYFVTITGGMDMTRTRPASFSLAVFVVFMRFLLPRGSGLLMGLYIAESLRKSERQSDGFGVNF
mgnify:CR=1 FL=1